MLHLISENKVSSYFPLLHPTENVSLVIFHDYKHTDFQIETVPETHRGEYTERLTLPEEESSIYKLQSINVKKIECIAMWFTLHSIIKANNSYFYSIYNRYFFFCRFLWQWKWINLKLYFFYIPWIYILSIRVFYIIWHRSYHSYKIERL